MLSTTSINRYHLFLLIMYNGHQDNKLFIFSAKLMFYDEYII